MSDARDVKLEPTAEEIERVGEAIKKSFSNYGIWDDMARAAILAMDRRAAPEGDWRVKDYADGWCWYRTEKEARESDEAKNGALVEFVPRASPPAMNIYESAALALELAASNWDELGEKRRGSHGRHLLDFAKAAGLREAAQVLRSLASLPAPAAPEHKDGYKRAFAAQSRKLQAVLHIPGVKETLAQLNWLEWDEGAPAVAVPEGWKLVPVDDPARPFADPIIPEAMVWAGIEAMDRADDDLRANKPDGIDWDTGMICVAVYRAMLAAAPTPPAGDAIERALADAERHEVMGIPSRQDVDALLQAMMTVDTSNTSIGRTALWVLAKQYLAALAPPAAEAPWLTVDDLAAALASDKAGDTP